MVRKTTVITWISIVIVFAGCSKGTTADTTALTKLDENSKQHIELQLDNAMTSITGLAKEVESLRQEITILKQRAEDEVTTHSLLSETDNPTNSQNNRSSIANWIYGIFLVLVAGYTVIIRSRSCSEKN